MKHVALLLTLAGTASFSFGCGDGGGGDLPTCGAFTACGGDITGTWTFDGVCSEGDIASSIVDTGDLPAECKDAVKSLAIDVSGTLTYANGTETSDVNLTMKMGMVYSSACITAVSGTPVAVTQAFCDTLASSYDPVDGPTVVCKLASGGCDCTMTMAEHTQESDTYMVSGGTLTYSDGDSVEFCVSGSKLTVRPSTDAGSPGMQFKLHRT